MNYDEILWNGIIKVLSENHNTIDVINRAQIVDDALNLARANEITYDLSFRIVSYLKNEHEYYPWYSALSGLDYLTRILGERSSAGIGLLNLQRDLIQNIRNNVSFALNSSNQIETFKARLVLARACRLGESSCVANATNLFDDYMNGVE